MELQQLGRACRRVMPHIQTWIGRKVAARLRRNSQETVNLMSGKEVPGQTGGQGVWRSCRAGVAVGLAGVFPARLVAAIGIGGADSTGVQLRLHRVGIGRTVGVAIKRRRRARRGDGPGGWCGAQRGCDAQGPLDLVMLVHDAFPCVVGGCMALTAALTLPGLPRTPVVRSRGRGCSNNPLRARKPELCLATRVGTHLPTHQKQPFTNLCTALALQLLSVRRVPKKAVAPCPRNHGLPQTLGGLQP